MRGVAWSWIGAVVAIGASIVVGGCAPRDPFVTMAGATRIGDWIIERQVDRVTGAPVPSATLVGRASNSGVDNAKQGVMQLTCFGGKPLVRFGFEFKVGTDTNSFLGYRFDDKPGRETVQGVRFQQDYRMAVIEDKADVAQFVSDLAGSSTLYVRIRSLNAGRTSVEFKLAGVETAIEPAFAGCPLTPETPTSKRTT